VWALQAGVLEKLDEPEEALASYRTALELDPQQPEANQNYASIARDPAALEQAIEGYRRQIALNPNDAVACNNLANACRELGRHREALEYFERAVALDPGYAEAHANLAMLHERLGDKDQAVQHWMKRYELGDPTDPWTARAEERLVALGVIQSYPGLKGKIYSRRRIVEDELKAHEQSTQEFHTVTERSGRWP